jgi:hypothetical protein
MPVHWHSLEALKNPALAPGRDGIAVTVAQAMLPRPGCPPGQGHGPRASLRLSEGVTASGKPQADSVSRARLGVPGPGRTVAIMSPGLSLSLRQPDLEAAASESRPRPLGLRRTQARTRIPLAS